MKRNNISLHISVLALGLMILVSACKKNPNDPGTEFAPQMYVSKPYEPLSQVQEHPINPQGINMREPAKGTVPRRRFNTVFEETDSSGNVVKTVDLMVYDDIPKDKYELAGQILKNPYPPTEKYLAEGAELYAQFCYPCHGTAGDGKGPVAEKYKGVANLKGSVYTAYPPGRIFHVITHGKGRMWSHASQLNPDERWKVVNHVLKLQGRLDEGQESEGEGQEEGAPVEESEAQAINN